MRAIILAAGIGSRLRPITNNIPKCLVEIEGKPILQYQIDSYIEAGIDDIVIVVGYLGHKVKEFIENKYANNKFITIIENKDYLETNNMYSLYLAKEYVSQDILISNGDVIISKRMISHIVDNQFESGIAVDVGNYNEESMKIKVKDGLVKHISKEIKKEDAYGTSIDIYKFCLNDAKKLINIIRNIIELENEKTSWTEVAIDKLLEQRQIAAIDIRDNYWYEIDNIEDLKLASLQIKERD